jgi:hypothetical protein
MGAGSDVTYYPLKADTTHMQDRAVTPMGLDALEPRVMMSGSAASITLADRGELLANLAPGSLATTLKYRLKAGDAAGFDQILLDRMVARQGAKYFFAPQDAAAYVQFAANDTYPDTSNLGPSIQAEKDAADKVLQHLFPQQVDSESYTVQLGSTIDWTTAPAGQGGNFLHGLNRHNYWPKLAEAYQMTGDRRYARELGSELQTWYVQSAPLRNPDAWSTAAGGQWWLLDAADRVGQWTRAYFTMLGSRGLTPEGNTLFLSGFLRHADFLSRVTARSAASNWTTLHAAALGELGTLFPEFTRAADWRAQGRALMNACLDRQFFADGGHVEQSPAYAASALHYMLEDFRLDAINGGTGWTRKARLRLTAATEAFYQLTQWTRKLPALSDTYENFPAAKLLARAGAVLGDPRYFVVGPGLEELWLLGPDAVTARRTADDWGGLRDRGAGFALPDAGYYMLRGRLWQRAGTPPYELDNTQLVFDAGPTGGTHGHFDLFNVVLSDQGTTKIADPGPWAYDDSPQRAVAQSTPAHNTISVDGLNHAPVDAAHSPLVSVDKFEVGSDFTMVSARHYAYSQLPGQPVVARTVWMDQRDEQSAAAIIVDWTSSSTVHTYTTSLTVPQVVGQAGPWDSDLIPGLGNAILMPGQTTRLDTAYITPSAPPAAPVQGTRWNASQTAKSAVFISVIGADSATLVEPIRRGRPIQIRVSVIGQPDRVVSFNPPDLAPPSAAITSAVKVATRSLAAAVGSQEAVVAVPSDLPPHPSVFSQTPIHKRDAVLSAENADEILS